MTQLDVQTPYDPDPTTLARLREIDPDADLVYVGHGKWALGVVAPPNSERRSRAAKLVKREFASGSPNLATVRLGQAALQGFRVVSNYTTAELRSGYAYQDFKVADWIYRQGRDKAFERSMKASEHGLTDEALEARREEAIYRAKDAWRFIMRGRKHFIPK